MTMLTKAAIAVVLVLVLCGCGGEEPKGDLPVIWAERAGGPGEDAARAVAVDPSGAVYVAGHFEQQAVFGEGEPGQSQLDGIGGGRDAFLARLTAEGELLWAVRAGGVGDDAVHSLAVAPDGSVFATGVFANGAVFGVGSATETELSTAAGNTFVARYDAAGELIWARATAGLWTAAEGCYRVSAAALEDGSVAIKGTFAGSATFGAGEQGETTLVASGSRDDFAARYDAAGALVWARRLGGSGGAGGIAALADGRLAAGGDFEHAVVLGAGEPGEVELTAAGLVDVYVAVLGSDGELAWAERAGSSGLETATGVAALGDGSFLLTGFFMGEITFDADEQGELTLESSGADTSYVARYSGGGAVAWAIPLGGGGWLDTCAVAPLPGDRFAVTGLFDDAAPAVLGQGTDRELTLESTGGLDVFLAVFDAQGSLSHGTSFGSSGYGAVDDAGNAVASGPDGSLVIAGSFEGDRLVLGTGSARADLANAGGADAFFAELRP